MDFHDKETTEPIVNENNFDAKNLFVCKSRKNTPDPTVKLFALAGIRERHLGARASETKRHLADILLGAELAATVYGAWDEDQTS